MQQNKAPAKPDPEHVLIPGLGEATVGINSVAGDVHGKRAKKILIILIPVFLISLMALVPVQTSDATCGLGHRFSIIFGQYEDYKKTNIIPTELLGCPQYIHNDVPDQLYIL